MKLSETTAQMSPRRAKAKNSQGLTIWYWGRMKEGKSP